VNAPRPSFVQRLRARLAVLARDSESGQAMTEFVLIFPIQLLLTLTIIQFAFIAHAHIVVAQASAMGARAAAVWQEGTGMSQEEAARRVVARQLGIITSGEAPETPPGPVAGGELRWDSKNGGREFSEARSQEAYGHLANGQVQLHPASLREQADKGYVACEVKYDYVMWIPVANHFFARPGSGFFFGSRQPPSDASLARGRTVFQVHRVGFMAIPWARGLGE
jgi:TadE-like protein